MPGLTESAISKLHKRLSDAEFERLGAFIQGSVGIKMPPHKRGMVELRLNRRLKVLGMESFEQYCRHVFDSEEGSREIPEMIDAITTNKTDFFREPAHFEHLVERALPEMLAEDPDLGVTRPFRVWSAGCSSGEEPYTIAVALHEFAELNEPFAFEVHATDVSVTMLQKAVQAVYLEERTECIPEHLLRKHFLRSRDREAALVRVAPHVRRSVRFRRLNLLEEDYPFGERMDAVFCRNVLIYFERPLQIETLRRLCGALREGGYLFVGHSETLHGMDLPLTHVAPTVYKKVST